ncbi:MAG: T9SS type A sorting domain-containing protein [Bacteroidetes bacterium]|nr:MAG: T9SS type A sorting domain-containing protein [Bacteroidota bacterium]TNE95876.1 MAG: T9SS type A sorting domain-containing protein [Bacteroidota bacterium]
MKKELREKLSKYAAAAAAVTGVAGVNAQIVYTDVNPDVTVDDDHNANGLSAIPLDMDNDSNLDFILGSRDTTINLYGGIDVRYTLVAPAVAGNAIAFASTSTYNGNTYYQAAALNNGDGINNTLTWASTTQTMAQEVLFASYPQYNYTLGFWNGVNDKYLGLRFTTGANTYYGWARLDVGGSNAADVFKLKDYAYQSSPNVAINAGDMGSASLSEADIDALVHFINQANNTVLVKVNGELSNGVVNVVATSGQVVQTGKVENGTFVVNMNGLTAGVYMINVTFEEGAITKKMYVH